jgi:hypothetical protein
LRRKAFARKVFKKWFRRKVKKLRRKRQNRLKRTRQAARAKKRKGASLKLKNLQKIKKRDLKLRPKRFQLFLNERKSKNTKVKQILDEFKVLRLRSKKVSKSGRLSSVLRKEIKDALAKRSLVSKRYLIPMREYAKPTKYITVSSKRAERELRNRKFKTLIQMYRKRRAAVIGKNTSSAFLNFRFSIKREERMKRSLYRPKRKKMYDPQSPILRPFKKHDGYKRLRRKYTAGALKTAKKQHFTQSLKSLTGPVTENLGVEEA